MSMTTWHWVGMIAIILVAYYVGTKSTVGAFSSAIDSLLLTLTGRDSSGKFASYPT